MSLQKKTQVLKIYHKKAHKWAYWLGRLPGVEAVFLSGSLAQGKGTKNSDIDFFILTTPGRIWTARFFIFLVLKCFGQLAKEHDHAGKICPNHFITTASLEIEEKDAYAANLFAHIKPLYDPDNVFSFFIETNRGWIEKFGSIRSLTPACLNSNKKTNMTNKFADARYTGMTFKKGFFEPFLRNLQIKKIKKNPEYNLPGAKIVLSDTELRFHPKPKNVDFPS